MKLIFLKLFKSIFILSFYHLKFLLGNLIYGQLIYNISFHFYSLKF
jgi:hypothetical protein